MFHVSRCRVFLIPRVAVQRAAGDSRSKFAMARPVFDLSCMRPLQRLANAHTKLYISVAIACLLVPCIACQSFLRDTFRAVSTLVLKSCLLIVHFGFISSKRHGLDRVAVKHVASSFRFAALSVLLAQWVLLNSRQAYQGAVPAAQPAALAVVCLVFLGCTLLECSPHLSTTTQILISVILRCFLRTLHVKAPLRWLIVLIVAAVAIQRIFTGNPHCSHQFGSYDVCDATQPLSFYTAPFLLM